MVSFTMGKLEVIVAIKVLKSSSCVWLTFDRDNSVGCTKISNVRIHPSIFLNYIGKLSWEIKKTGSVILSYQN